ncbi:ABC transporter substrate-binding protein [Treponema ruminis]|uniref:Oligogalacturonide transport system substrate-binding protein n=1 Tax=Treponema ruminis TaxID=744515 RepID=A0A7W8LN39_9SPIR|nr:ABC transporter substrate-binding protein [Treponema ruminis]MBB5227060.1 oligogalacturonide transport system substrate-binding protein [Treponema ruminis]
MRNDKSFLSIILIFLSLLLSGCGKKAEENQLRTIKFSWWGSESRADYTLKGIEAFEAENPSVKIEAEYDTWSRYEKTFEEDVAAGQSADVMQINFDWLDKYSPDGKGFYDINTLAEYVDLYNYTLNDLDYGTIKGKLNAIPIAFNTAIPVFDKTFFEKNSLKIPSTWDELFALAKILKQKDMYVFTLSNRHLLFLAIAWFEQTFSKRVFNQSGGLNISEEEVGQIFDFVRRLVQENVIYSPTRGFKISALREGKIVGALLWCNEISLFVKEVESLGGSAALGNFITTPGASESGWYLKPASMYAIKKDCKNPEAAAKFLNYLLNNQDFALLQKNDKGVPVSNKSLTALMENNQLESLQYFALMKIRFNRGSINAMIPVMDDNTVIKSFAENAFDYADGKASKADSVKSFLENW